MDIRDSLSYGSWGAIHVQEKAVAYSAVAPLFFCLEIGVTLRRSVERQIGVTMSKVLFDEHPLVIPVETAKKLGLEEAIILQQVHYWLQDKAKAADPKFFHDGRYWIYDTYDDWKDAFPFWSISTIRRKIAGLEKSGMLLSANYNENATARMKWYSIDYDKLEKAVQPEQMEVPNMDKCNCSDRTDATVQNEQMDLSKMNSSYNNIYNKDTHTETSTKTSKQIPPTPPAGAAEQKGSQTTLMERFEIFYKAYPRHKSRGDAEKAWKSLKPDDALLAKIMKALEVAKKDPNWQKNNGQFVPYPASWLRAKGWEDEQNTNSNASGGHRDDKKGWGGYLC